MINKAIDLLYLAKQSNIEITLLDGKLQLKVPKDTAIDKSLLEEIKTHKQLIIDFLQSNFLSKTVNKISKTEKKKSLIVISLCLTVRSVYGFSTKWKVACNIICLQFFD
jgi:hypothetical protein